MLLVDVQSTCMLLLLLEICWTIFVFFLLCYVCMNEATGIILYMFVVYLGYVVMIIGCTILHSEQISYIL